MSQLLLIQQALMDYAKNTAHIDGIKSYESSQPVKIDSAEMPIMFVVVGPATRTEVGTGITEEERIFKIQVAVAYASAGLSTNLNEQATTILENSIDAFEKLETINISGVQEIICEEDTGIAIMEGYKNNLIGFEIPIRIKCIRTFIPLDIQE